MEKEDPERCARYRERAKDFARQFIYWFDDSGAALPFGRSLTYRFSQVSFFSACLMAGVEPFSVGVMKGLIVRHLCNWMKKPIFDRDDILTIGYGYPNLIMGENYNGPGSPYWALKTFAILMLPDDHAFWKASPEPIPPLREQIALPYADMLIRRYPGHTTAFVPGRYSPYGHGQTPAKYGKFAYDTGFAFSVAKSTCEIAEAATDSMLAFVTGGYVYPRRICKSFYVTDTGIVSEWIPCEGIHVTTVITPTREGHIRRHLVISDKECIAYDSGFAVEIDVEKEVQQAGEDTALLANYYSSCLVRRLRGEGAGEIIPTACNTNLLHAMTRIPAIKYQIKKGRNEIETEIKAQYGKAF